VAQIIITAAAVAAAEESTQELVAVQPVMVAAAEVHGNKQVDP
jgi:cytochrome bd-type quinol oxidase subunit 1